MHRLNSLEDALGLEPRALRDLLVEGDSPERIWAAWALGLRFGGAFAPEASAQSRRDLDPGVRRHLVVLLAGMKEEAAIRVIAENDPDPYVRATAHRYAVEVTGEDAVAAALAAATSDPSEIVREECLRMLEGKWAPSRRHELVFLLGDPALGVRQAATDRLAEGTLASSELPEVTREAIEEPDPDLRRRLMTLLVDSGGVPDIGMALADLPVDGATELMDLLQASGVRMSWGDLAATTRRAVPALDRRVLQLLREAEEADLLWLARCAVRSLSSPSGRNRAEAEVARDVRVAADAARNALVAKVSTIDPMPLGRDHRELFLALIDSLRTEEADLRAQQEDLMEDDEWFPACLEQLAEQRRRLAEFVMASETPSGGRS